MKTSRLRLATAVSNLLEENIDQSTLIDSLAAYLIAENRVNELPSLMRDLDKVRFLRTGRSEMTVESARELSSEVLDLLQSYFGVDNSVVNRVINKEIIGGARVCVLDKELDYSVQTRLMRLKNRRN